MQAGNASGVFSQRNTGLMQNKRASLNIQNEKLQSASGACFCVAHPFFLLPFSFNTLYFDTFFHALPALNDGRYFVLQVQTRILLIHQGGHWIFRALGAADCFYHTRIGRKFPCTHAGFRLCCATKQVRRHIQFSSLGEGVRRITKT